MRTYGLALADYDAMLVAQNNLCAICRVDKPGGNSTHWHVDHNHVTGQVRGLLCGRCNLGLGYFRDDTGRLASAITYLEGDKAA